MESMSNPKITCVLTSYNRDTLLEQAIQSVLSQSFADYELFIMDDDSENPKTHAVLDKHEGKPGITIYRHKLNGTPRFSRTGYAENINRALDISSGEYITYLTCDDIYLPGRFRRMVDHLDANQTHMACYGIQRLVDMHGDRMVLRGYRNEGPVVPAAACLLDHNQVMHRRSCIDTLGKPLWPTGPELIGMADAATWEKFRIAGMPFYRIAGDEPTDEHRFHPGSIQGGAKA